jgi:hypothetical protein
MLPVVLSGGGGLRLLIGAVPIILLVVVFGLIALISLVLPKERRDYVLQLIAVVVQLVRVIAPQSSKS